MNCTNQCSKKLWAKSRLVCFAGVLIWSLSGLSCQGCLNGAQPATQESAQLAERNVSDPSQIIPRAHDANSRSSPSDNATWDFVRGPNYDGNSSEKNLLGEWSAEGPPVVWHRSLGQGYSSVTGRNNRIFTQYQTVTGQYLICLDSLTGATLWEYQHSWPYDPAGLYPGPQSTPTLDQKYVYFTSPQGTVGCLDQLNGTVIWQFDLLERFAAKGIEFGYSCSPVLVDGVIYLPVGGSNASMVALRASDGATIWQSGNEPISHSSALPIEYGKRRLVVGYLKNAIQLYDARDGAVLSTIMLSEGYDEHSAWPIYREPVLWFSGPFRSGSMWIEIVGNDSPTLELRRESELLSNDVCSTILVGDHLYGFDLVDVQSKVHRPSRGLFRCIEFASAREAWANGSLRERRQLETDASVPASSTIGHAAVIQADGKLIMLNDVGELIVAWADPQSYREIGRVRLLGGSICWTQPMLLNGLVYVRDHSRVVCVALGDPRDVPVDAETMLTAAELPVASYRDWSAWILSVEPEYAMTAPTPQWLLRWYWITLLCGWAVAPVVGILVAEVLAWRIGRKRYAAAYDGVWTGTAFGLGLLGTTWLSYWTDEFEFTWPLSLAIAFQWVVALASLRRGDPVEYPWLTRTAFAIFVMSIIGYFLICRRLSLAFEWSFLTGYPAALPFLLAIRFWKNRSGWRWHLSKWLLTAVAYTAFYWMGAGIMLWKYQP